MRAIQLEDMLGYTYLSQLAYAPGGERAAFVAARAEEDRKGYGRRLWLWDGASLRQLTDIGKESTFVWEDATHLLFPAARTAQEKERAEAHEGVSFWYRLDVTGGEALRAFTLPFPCRRLIPLGEGRYAALGTIDRQIPDYHQMTKAARARVDADRKADADYEVFDEISFWSNGEGVTNGSRTALFLCEPERELFTRVTGADESVVSCCVLGGKLWYSSSTWQTVRPLLGCRISVLDPATGEAHEVASDERLAPPQLEAMGDRLVAFTSRCDRYGVNEGRWSWLVDPDTGTLSVLREEEFGYYSSVGSDCRLGGGRALAEREGSLYHITTRRCSSHLYRLDADGSDTPVLEKDGSIDMIAADEGTDTLLLVAMYDMRLQELYALRLSDGRLTRLSHFNDAALKGRYVAKPEPLSLEREGHTVDGWILRPKDYDPAKRYPAVLDIHGGPKTVYGPVFMHEMQLWASMGYFVFYCDPKGSDGRGNEFMDIRGQYGTVDYRDLMAFTDAVLARYPQIDASRVCETGGSYGGFMTNWIVGHTDRFCCAASQRSISNWLSFWSVSDIGWYFAPDQNAADLFTSPEKLWERSPLRYVSGAVTPTLFIHSDEDYRCPLEQGLQMYTALVQRGVPARLVLFHGETHELSRSGRPDHRLRRLREITDWFEAHARG